MIDVSFIVTAHNSERYIKRCLDSISNQKESTLTMELIVIDDGSTDSTRSLLSIYESSANIHLTENQGVEAASNLGIKLSKGRFICRLDADDELSEFFLRDVSMHLISDDIFYYGNYYVMDSNSEIISKIILPVFSKEEILNRGDFLATGTIIPRKIFDFFGNYNEVIKNCGLESYELIVRLIMAEVKGFHIDETLFSYRVHSLNMSRVKKAEIIVYGIKIMKKYADKDFVVNEFHPYGLDLNE